jgi:sugar O-acyltransferase (sialic acid O-acetyltransferase NeuD family)
MMEITTIGFTESHLLMISEILLSNNIDSKIFIFDNQNRFSSEKNFIFQPYYFINSLDDHENYVFGMAKPSGKHFLFNQFVKFKDKFINLIHKNSTISTKCEMGIGIRIEPNVCVGPKTKIGNYVNINRNSNIGHHCMISDFVTINPGCTIVGDITLKDGVEIGAGTTILNDVTIGSNTIIGAGSLVTKNVPDNVVAYGNPCKIIRENV